MKTGKEHIAAPECRYCGDDATGVDALGRAACEQHIEEIADDLAAAALVRERDANETGERLTVDELAESIGIRIEEVGSDE